MWDWECLWENIEKTQFCCKLYKPFWFPRFAQELQMSRMISLQFLPKLCGAELCGPAHQYSRAYGPPTTILYLHVLFYFLFTGIQFFPNNNKRSERRLYEILLHYMLFFCMWRGVVLCSGDITTSETVHFKTLPNPQPPHSALYNSFANIKNKQKLVLCWNKILISPQSYHLQNNLHISHSCPFFLRLFIAIISPL